MKRGFCYSLFGLIFSVLFFVLSAQAQTWKELYDRADSLHKAAAYDSAVVIGKIALGEAEKEFSKVDTTVASVLNLLGKCYCQQGNYTEAQTVFNRALAIRTESLGPNHPDVAASLNNLGFLYKNQARYAQAESSFKQALVVKERVLGPDHPDVAFSLVGLGAVYYEQGEYAEAEPLYKQALAISEKSLGRDHPSVATILNTLANLYYSEAKYAQAEDLYRRALRITEKSEGPDHLHVAIKLYNLGMLYSTWGRYAEAEPLLKRALSITQKTQGTDHPDVARCLDELASVYAQQGKYVEAEPLYKRVLVIREESLGPDHPVVAGSLNNLALLYCDQGKYAQAESLYKRALDIKEKIFGPEHPDVALSLNNLGALYVDQGKCTEGEALHRRALAIREKALGADHPDVASSLYNLADLCTRQRRYTEAESLHNRALAIGEKALGPDHPDVAGSLNGLAILCRDQGKYAKAEPLFQRCVGINEKTLGPNHPDLAVNLSEWALLCRDMGRFDDSRVKEKRAFTIRRQNLKDNSAVLSERDALSYSKFMRDEAGQYISILLDSKDKSAECLREIADVVFSTKGQVSDDIFARHKAETSYSDTSLKALADSLRYARFKLSNLYVRGPEKEDYKGYRDELSQASQEKQRLESELARRSSDFRKELELWEIDCRKIANLLPSNSALLEYMKFDRLRAKGHETEEHYLLLALDHKENLHIFDLGSSEKIDSLVGLYRLHFQDISKRGSPFPKDLENHKHIAKSLYERILKPVEDDLEDANLVLFAPDGELNLLSFAGLTDREGNYLIENRPIHYLSSARDLVRLKDKTNPNQGLFAAGDPDFEASAQKRAPSSSLYAQAQDSDLSLYTLRNIRSGCEELNKTEVLPLPATRKELEKISSAWRKKTKEPAWVYLGPLASEENVKANAPGKKVIHLATHGYYVQGYCQADIPKVKSKSQPFVGENPLLLSGLFLAGANLHGQGAESLKVEDGILTAEEVTGLNLKGTRWVVLSACESGLGEVKSGEGVYGLRRAFQMAGASTTISALWPVADKTTADMMSYLYDYQEKDLALAMQSLYKKKLQELRKRHQPDHPYLWAAFIALGDWR